MFDLPALLIDIDGIICDSRQRHHLMDKNSYYWPSQLARDAPIEGAIDFLADMHRHFTIVFLAFRPERTLKYTCRWLGAHVSPGGIVLVSDCPDCLLDQVNRLKKDLRVTIAAGLGTQADDDRLFRRLKCKRLVVKEWEPDFAATRKRLFNFQRITGV